ncbi:hypothetical protein HDU82_008253 [Entophlyctis luteolus]|nr:hypothetical protein HDU82_008253 [Entophlyctis luteolus]
MGKWHTYCLVCGIGMTSHSGRFALPDHVNRWWDRQRGLAIDSRQFTPLATSGFYGDVHLVPAGSLADEWDSLPVDRSASDQMFTFNVYDENAQLCYQFHSKCAALVSKRLAAKGLSVDHLLDWLKNACPITECIVQWIPNMPDPNGLNKRQGQKFNLDIASLWLLASFDGPIEFKLRQRLLSHEDQKVWKENIHKDLRRLDDPSFELLVPHLFRHRCYNNLIFSPLLPVQDIGSRIRIWKGEITALEVDAVVNSTTRDLEGKGSVERKIHTVAGPGLATECSKITHPRCNVGQAISTNAYNLKAKRVIHTAAAPTESFISTLKSCYTSCLELAKAEGLRSIALPAVSASDQGYATLTTVDAAQVAFEAVADFLERCSPSDFELVYFCVSSDADAIVYSELMNTQSRHPIAKALTAPKPALSFTSSCDLFSIGLGSLNLDICGEIIEFLDRRAMLTLFGANTNWRKFGQEYFRRKCKKEGFACIPGKEAETLARSDINWQCMYFCYESLSRRRVDARVDWIVKSVDSSRK